MTEREAADERLQEVLGRTGAPDPRPLHRESLLQLKKLDPERFQRAVRYFDGKLLPEVLSEDSDPLAAWLEYGRFLAALRTDGAAVQIDPSGRSEPYTPPVPRDRLVLHLPTSARETAIPIGMPDTLSPAQKAAYDLLVLRRVS